MVTTGHENRAPTTTSRVLQLLGLLQSRRVWTGEELAERLGVTGRSVRRDIERLRDLGYPVSASKGHGGGYQLGAGAALPPLLLDADEAVAMAVCLRLAAGGSVAGVGESALRALSKLDQVMPARLRSQVAAVHDATVTLTPYPNNPVDPDVLMTLARACRDHEHIATGYTDLRGNVTQRRLEPYQLVTTGRRWYLLAYDRDREDWRSLRLDRMSEVLARGTTFSAREAPDAAAYISRSISSSPYRYIAQVRYHASAEFVAQHFSPAAATIEADGPEACLVTAGADDPQQLALYLAMVGCDFDIIGPPEVIAGAQSMAERLRRAASGGG
ncbi:helix-turn-helix transcriptional regulator [Mycolicibacterium komossense]|uniref:YafY family transcriptional regulator n=1 Tax=Mycolicibacterium komossense TaxID=1779 RepID=A0ABT3CDE9_9MYCO|nr:YafY family protein [Mycolicibacterium komossense]MCV7227498.1 YafY family transcriptional regulator [Mycolicibacterium komossense]